LEKEGRGAPKCSAVFDFAGILGILDPETGKNSRAFWSASSLFFQGVPPGKT
jgi:hypothetical protein